MKFSKFLTKFKQKKGCKNKNPKEDQLKNTTHEIHHNQSFLNEYQLSKASSIKSIDDFEKLISNEKIQNWQNDEICENIKHSLITAEKHFNNLAHKAHSNNIPNNFSEFFAEFSEIGEELLLTKHIALFFIAANENDEIMKRAVNGLHYIMYDEDHPLCMESFRSNNRFTTPMSILAGYQGDNSFYTEYIYPVFRETGDSINRANQRLR